MATVTINVTSIDTAWPSPSGAATDIDEAVASADGSTYSAGATAEGSGAVFGFGSPGLSDADTITNISVTIRYLDNGTAGTTTCDVDLFVGGVLRGTAVNTGAVTSGLANYGPLNDTGWNSDWTQSQLDNIQVRLTPQQSGMPGTNLPAADCVDVVITYTAAPIGITVPQGDLTLSSTVPTVEASANPIDITVPQGDLVLSTVAPSMGFEFFPPATDLSLMAQSFSQVSTDSWTGNDTSATLSAMGLGNPGAGRVLYVLLTMYHNVSTANPATLTINGDSATSIVQAQSTGQFERCAIFVLPQSSMSDPNATAADVVVTAPAAGGNMRAALVTIYRGVGYDTSASDTGTDIDNDPVSTTVTFPANGIVFGSAASNNGAADTTTWTNLTEINDDLLFFQTFSQAVDSGAAPGSTAVSAAWGTETITALAVAAFAVSESNAPALDFGFNPPQADLGLSSVTPDVASPLDLIIPQGNLALSTTAPVTGEDRSIDVPQADLALSTAAASLDFGLPLTQADLALSTVAPVALQAYNIDIPQADLALSATAPAVGTGANPDITIPQADLALSTTAPAVIGGSRSFDIPQANLTLSTTALTVESSAASVVFAPPVANLALSTREPWVEQPVSGTITVFNGNLALTGSAPVVGRGDSNITVPQANLVFRSDPLLRGGTGFVRASRFDGASDALTISGLTGAAAGTDGTLSCALRRQPPDLDNRTFEPPHIDMALLGVAPEILDSSAGDRLRTVPTAEMFLSTTSPTVLTSVDINAQTLLYIGTGQDFGLKIEILPNGLIRAIARQADDTVIFTCTSGTYRLARDGIDRHIHVHWSGTACVIKVDGTDVSDNTAGTAGNIAYVDKVTIGASDDSSQPNRLNADLGVIFFDDTEISDSERFRHSPSGQFRWIGADGSGAGGSTPLVYLNNDYLNLGLNNASGGDFTTDGGLEEATDFGAFTDSVLVTVPQADLALSATASDLTAGLPVPTADLTLSTTAPTALQAHNANPAQGDLILSATAPSAVDSGSGAKDIAVPQADLALSSSAVGQDLGVAGTSGDLLLSTTAPTRLEEHFASIPQADLTLSGPAGAAVTNIIISVPSADLALSASAPSAEQAHSAPVPVVDLALSTSAPTRLLAEARAPPQADLALAATAPALDFGFPVPQANLALSATAPTVGGDHSVTVPQGNLALSTTAPQITESTQTVISPPTGSLALSTTAPTVSTPTVSLLEVADPGATALFHPEKTEALFHPEKTEALFD